MVFGGNALNTIDFETFLAIVESQSLSNASKELHIAQTTVSQRLKVLEKTLGIRLIERGKGIKEIRLTPSGEEFFKLAEQWRFIQRSTELLQSQGPKLSLVFGVVDSINTFVMPPIYEDLIKHQPPINLTIQTLHTSEIYEKIERRQIDVGFVVRDRVHPNVIVTKCFNSPMVGLCTKRAELKSDKIHPTELDPNHELFLPWGHDFHIWHDYWYSSPSSTRIKIDSTNLLMKLLSKPEQWSVVPQWFANQALRTGNFSVFQLTNPPTPFTCYKLVHKQPTKITQKALDVLDHYFSPEWIQHNTQSL